MFCQVRDVYHGASAWIVVEFCCDFLSLSQTKSESCDNWVSWFCWSRDSVSIQRSSWLMTLACNKRHPQYSSMQHSHALLLKINVLVLRDYVIQDW